MLTHTKLATTDEMLATLVNWADTLTLLLALAEVAGRGTMGS